MDLRLKLEDRMLLFIAYDENMLSEIIGWFDFIDELKTQFPNHLDVVMFTNNAEEKLLDVLKDASKNENSENPEDSKAIYPAAILCHPHIFEPQIYIEIDPFDLYKIIEKYDEYYTHYFKKEKSEMYEKIEKLLNTFPVVIFIKGSPHDPFCKFSKSFIEVIKETGIRYRSFDIFKDEKLRCWLRLYSGWKTYPQIYVNGKIIGGLDKMKELIEKGEFMNLIPNECKREGSIEYIKEFLKSNELVVFGKGTRENVSCKASKEVYEILDKNNINFAIFDVKKDEMIRELIKELYNYHYFPQIYCNCKLLGGLKFLKEVEDRNAIYEYIPISCHKYYEENKSEFDKIFGSNGTAQYTIVKLFDKSKENEYSEQLKSIGSKYEDTKQIYAQDFPFLEKLLINELKLGHMNKILIIQQLRIVSRY